MEKKSCPWLAGSTTTSPEGNRCCPKNKLFVTGLVVQPRARIVFSGVIYPRTQPLVARAQGSEHAGMRVRSELFVRELQQVATSEWRRRWSRLRPRTRNWATTTRPDEPRCSAMAEGDLPFRGQCAAPSSASAPVILADLVSARARRPRRSGGMEKTCLHAPASAAVRERPPDAIARDRGLAIASARARSFFGQIPRHGCTP